MPDVRRAVTGHARKEKAPMSEEQIDGLLGAPGAADDALGVEAGEDGEGSGFVAVGTLIRNLEELLADTGGRVDLEWWVASAAPLVGEAEREALATRARTAWLWYWTITRPMEGLPGT